MHPLVGAVELAGDVVALLGDLAAEEGGDPGAIEEAITNS